MPSKSKLKPSLRYDIYRGTKDRSLRLATLPGAKLPAHLSPKDSTIVRVENSPIHFDAALGTLPPTAIAFFKLSLEMIQRR